MNIKELTNAIISNEWSDKDLTLMINAIKHKRDMAAKQVTSQLCIGDTVQWTGKNGIRKTGTVQRVAIKYVTVKTNTEYGTIWKVPACMLTICAQEPIVINSLAVAA